MEEGDNLWSGRMLYREFCSTVPTFDNLRTGQGEDFSTYDDDGKLVYQITENKLDRLNSDFLNFFEAMSTVFPSLKSYVDEMKASRREVNYWIQDVENNQLHQVSVNQQEGTMTYISSHEIEFDERGNILDSPSKKNEIDKVDFRGMVKSEGFKNNFTSLGQHIKD